MKTEPTNYSFTTKLVEEGAPISEAVTKRIIEAHKKLEAELWETVFGPVQEQRNTALRVRGTSFEVVELDGDGLVIEPKRCTCRWAVIADPNCEIHRGCYT